MPKSKILVVDDSQVVRLTIQRILTNADYEVITAPDGFLAMERLAENPELIVLDIKMPGLDGYGVCEQLNQVDSEFNHLPIVFLTTVQSHALELLGQRYGAYLRKPVDPQQLLSTIEEQLHQSSFVKPVN